MTERLLQVGRCPQESRKDKQQFFTCWKLCWGGPYGDVHPITMVEKIVAERAARFAHALGHSEERFVELALQSLVDEAGLKLKVAVDVA